MSFTIDESGLSDPVLVRELRRLAVAVSTLQAGHLEPLRVAPTKPQIGDIVYANGTDWNPGGGAGLYEYTGVGGGNKWRMLASGVQY